MILFYGLMLSIFLEYVSPGVFIPVIAATKIGTIVPLLTFVFAIAQARPVSNSDVWADKSTKWIAFYLVLLIISMFTAEVTFYSWTIFKFVLGYVFWYIMLVKLVTDLEKLRKVVGILAISHILILMLNPMVILEPETRNYLQAAPFLGDGNDFSLSAGVLLPLCLWLMVTTNGKVKKLLYVAAVGAILLAIIGTQSRGASLALAGTFGFLWWKGRRKMVGVAAIAIVAVVVVSFAPPQYFERMRTISDYQHEGSAMGRIVAWKTGVRMAMKYPLTGVSSGHFPVALGTEFRPPEFGDENQPWLTAHSMYFLVLGELGVPGVICFLGLLASNYRRLARLLRDARDRVAEEGQMYPQLFLMLSASLIAFCIGGAFLSVAYYPHIFVLSGLIAAAANIYEKRNAEESDRPVS